ncbi:MAG TPA: lipopolysaccharide assembly protein LapA domain-containing protein [Stellaceae bacterium]|nr:lipopolysaccharide assembly protein LapA domain-containing protein [Stellaceae bacterium]
MKLLWWIALAVVALVLILFAVSNRESVSVGLWPLPDFVEMPLYLLVLGTLIVGFFVGELVGRVGGWRWRREARRSRERIADLERALDAERARPVVTRLPAEPVA